MRKHKKTLKEIRKYVQENYWQNGKTKKISGYENNSIAKQLGFANRLTKLLDMVYPINSSTWLDLGCAYGQFVYSSVVKGGDAFGIDISDYAIEEGQKECPELEDRIFQGSIHKLDMFDDNTFDFIYSNQVFEHIPSRYCKELASECFRVMKPGTTLWCGLVLDMGNDFQPQGYNPEDPDLSHINIRPSDWWDKIFLNAGFELDEEFDTKWRAVKDTDGYSFFDEYGWHSICYKKPME